MALDSMDYRGSCQRVRGARSSLSCLTLFYGSCRVNTPEVQRDAVQMVRYKGMGCENIAAHLNTPIGIIKSRVSRGRNTLRLAMYA